MSTTSRAGNGPVPLTAPSPEIVSVGRLRRWWRAAFLPFWVVPGLWCVAAVVAGLVLPKVEQSVGSIPIAVASGPDGARAVLSTIAGAMISVTGLVFSITIVVLQLASSQFTPRVLRSFLDDRVTQNTLGVFAASFLYSLSVLRAVRGSNDITSVAVPQLAVTVAFVLVVAAVGMFLAFIHHITSSIAVESVIGRVSDECRRIIESGLGHEDGLPTTAPELPDLPGQHVVVADRSGYLDLVDRGRLCAAAARHDARVELLHPLGTFVAEGAPLAVVRLPGAAAPADVNWAALVAGGVVLSTERSMQQDLSFGFRRLVDIAERALSPGVNDPTTAVQAIDRLHDLLRRIAVLPDVHPVTLDEDDVPRVVTRERSFGDHLDLAVDEIAHYGRGSLQVPRRLDAMLEDLATVTSGDRAGAVAAKRAAVLAD
ncbi:MAG: hypothetical protein CMH83_05885 [Nocardioides sp.]|nr:hypothetical protein [Nocardioides sp.]